MGGNRSDLVDKSSNRANQRLSDVKFTVPFDRQVAELQVRIAVLNGYTALGIPVTVAVG